MNFWFEVVEKIGPDVKCWCADSGLLLSRANLALWRKGRLVQQRNAILPVITSKVGVTRSTLYHLHISDFKL